MPFFRGIEISIHASLEARQVTEYPHPDGSSVRLMRATTLPVICNAATGTSRPPQPDVPPAPEDIDPTRLKKVNPRISVYIPSLPGEQFWLRYLISQSPPPSRCVFFKMTMNGRHISSWGINTNTHSTGLVVRALYQPEARWGDACGYNEAGYPGIETRYFHFMPGLDKKSVAEDGGIIEVQVFRCKGRKRIAVELDLYRNQERYGITSPSGGLVDNPEDATYYNYYLIDAKDSPYATFCFHYRSMKYLKQLNLVPQPGLDMSPACRSSLDSRRERPSERSRSRSNSPLLRRFTFDATTLGSQVFNDNFGVIEGDEVSHAEASAQEDYFLKSPPELSSLKGAVAKATSQTPELEPSGEVQQRPLPEIPSVQARPTSASSLRSSCPSLTPSLRLYVESDDFENEEIRLSTAHPMLITSESMQALELVDTGAEEGASFSDYASSPGSTEASRSPRLPSPRGYIPTTGSVLERHLTQYDSPIAGSSPFQTQNRPSSKTGGPLDSHPIEPRTVALNLTEAEWLRHSPSPLQRKEERAERLWSPQPGLCLDRTVGISDSDGQRDNRNMEHDTGAIGRAPVGNWI